MGQIIDNCFTDVDIFLMKIILKKINKSFPETENLKIR